MMDDLDLDKVDVDIPEPEGSCSTDSSWVTDLENALADGGDFSAVRNIAKNRAVPQDTRSKLWQVLLGVSNKPDPFVGWDELFNLKEQAAIRQDSKKVADKLGNPESDRLSVTSDLESVITLFCKTQSLSYSSNNGWTDILQLLLCLKLNRQQLYNAFFSLVTKYVPRGCEPDGRPFDLFRLLLLYHDPQLCSFLDTRKIMPHMYANQWFNSLMSANCDLEVVLKMWDVYLQQADPFLVFFMALVMLVNAKDQITEMKGESVEKIAECISNFPCQLSVEDIEDFCQLASYYSTRTPQSFRRDYHGPLFGSNLAEAFENVTVHSLLCLPVSVPELLGSNHLNEDAVQYFVVDSRPMKQYTNGHLPGAFNLDASLLVEKPAEFHLAVQSLGAFKAKTHPLDHLCFMGSGREEEDQYLHMLISSFLQKGMQYVSLARGGYAGLHEVLRESLSTRLKSHSVKGCIACNSGPKREKAVQIPPMTPDSPSGDKSFSLFNKMKKAVKSGSVVVKDKVVDYIVNTPTEEQPKHVEPKERHGKRYRNMASVFSIGEGESDESGEDSDHIPREKSEQNSGTKNSSSKSMRDGVDLSELTRPTAEKVALSQWLKQPDIREKFECQQVDDGGYLHPSILAMSRTHLFVLRRSPDKKDSATVESRRPLSNIHKITSKKRIPELLTFKYGYEVVPGQQKTTGVDRFVIPLAGECAKALKYAIVGLQGTDIMGANGVTDKNDGGVTEKMSDGVSEKKSDGVTETKSDGVTEKNADGVTETKSDGVTETKSEGVKEQNCDGVAEKPREEDNKKEEEVVD